MVGVALRSTILTWMEFEHSNCRVLSSGIVDAEVTASHVLYMVGVALRSTILTWMEFEHSNCRVQWL